MGIDDVEEIAVVVTDWMEVAGALVIAAVVEGIGDEGDALVVGTLVVI